MQGGGKRWWLAVVLFALGAGAWAEAPATIDPVRALLAGDYAAVDGRMQAVQDLYKRGAITDEQLLAAFRAFYDIDPADGHRLSEWVSAFPRSYVARLARGIYYKHVSQRFGRAWQNPDTRDDRMGSQEEARTAALDDLYASMKLDDKPLLSYFYAIDLEPPFWRRPPKQLLADAIAIDPHNFIVRQEFLITMAASMGGRGARPMKTFIDEHRAALPVEQVRRLESEVLVDEAWVQRFRNNDRKGSETLLQQALKLDPDNRNGNWMVLKAAVRTQDCDIVIPVATRLLEQSNADSAEILQRRAFCYYQVHRESESMADYKLAAERGDSFVQREIARFHWHGLNGFEKDPEQARYWLQKSAEAGDEKAQREMQRTFHTEIKVAPATEDGAFNGYLWHHAATLAIAVFGSTFLFRGFNPGDSRETYELRDLPLMRHPHKALYISCVAGVLFAMSAAFMAWSVYLPWQSWKFLVLVVLSLLALYRVLRFFFERIELANDRIVIRNLWRRPRELRWVDLRSVACDDAPRFQLIFDPGGVAMVSVYLTGLQHFARIVLTRARHSVADESTRDVLLLLAADEDAKNDPWAFRRDWSGKSANHPI